MEERYISIKEFAERAGVSPQSVYKRLTTSLQPYSTMVDNQKMLNIQALQDIYGVKVDNPIQPDIQPNNQQVDNPIQPDIQTLIDSFNEQLRAKDQQIERLMQQADETMTERQDMVERSLYEAAVNQSNVKDEQIKELNERLKEAQKALDQEQQLHLLSKQRVLQLEAAVETPEPDTSEPDLTDLQERPEQQEPVKQKWWQRLFFG